MEIHYLSNDPVNYSPDASPAKFSHIGDTKCERLNLQHSATNIVLPDHNYDDRLGTFHTPKLSILLLDGSYSHLTKTFNDESHPHFSRLCFKSRRTSSQAQQVVRLKRFITKKRSNNFLTNDLSQLWTRVAYLPDNIYHLIFSTTGTITMQT